MHNRATGEEPIAATPPTSKGEARPAESRLELRRELKGLGMLYVVFAAICAFLGTQCVAAGHAVKGDGASDAR